MSATLFEQRLAGAAEFAAFVFLVCALCANPAAAQERVFRIGAGSQVQFVSDAPLERITGSTSKVVGEVRVDPGAPKAASAHISVPVASIRTNNDLRDEHLRSNNWLDAARYPNIDVIVTGVTGIDALVPETAQEATVAAKLTIHGVTQAISTRARVRFRSASAAAGEGDALRVQASFVVKLVEHNVSIPSIVSLKVSPNIQVNVDLLGRTEPIALTPTAAPVPQSAPAAPVPKEASKPSGGVSSETKELAPPRTPRPPTKASGSQPARNEREIVHAGVGRAAAQSGGAVRDRPMPGPERVPQGKQLLIAPEAGIAHQVQRLRALMRRTRIALDANEMEKAEKLVRAAQSVLAHMEGEPDCGFEDGARTNAAGPPLTSPAQVTLPLTP